MFDPYVRTPVLVLGAAGFVGRWVARALAHSRAALSLVVRDVHRAEEILGPLDVQGQMLRCDLERAGEIGALLRSVRPAVVFNLAGYGVDPSERDASRLARLNAGLVQEIAETLATVNGPHWPGPRLVHVGSAAEYGNAGGSLREDARPRPTTAYGQTKLAGTRAVQEVARGQRFSAVTARLFTVYGPGEHEPRLLPTLLRARHTEAPIELTRGEQQRDFTYIEDVAEGLLRLGVAHVAPGEIVNLATGRLTPVRTFVEIAAGILGLDPARLDFGAIPARPEEMNHDPVAVARLEALTGWRPATTLAEGVSRTRHWVGTPTQSNRPPAGVLG